MSGLARVLHDRGIVVTGSDLKLSRYARALQDAGILVHVGHAADNLGDPEVVVVSSAIPETNPELVAARERGIPVWPRAKMLAHLVGDDIGVAVAGTHGKTTTSSMMATVLVGMGLDPTFLIGGELNDMGANARCGSGGYCVVEADESDGSFLNLAPTVAIITNVEADHLDHYGSFEAVVETFGRFIESVAPDGVVVVCADDEVLVSVAKERSRARVVTYGAAEGADVRCIDLKRSARAAPVLGGVPGRLRESRDDHCARGPQRDQRDWRARGHLGPGSGHRRRGLGACVVRGRASPLRLGG